jgi:hypothetical protein
MVMVSVMRGHPWWLAQYPRAAARGPWAFYILSCLPACAAQADKRDVVVLAASR